jgi:hypothetical protein
MSIKPSARSRIERRPATGRASPKPAPVPTLEDIHKKDQLHRQRARLLACLRRLGYKIADRHTTDNLLKAHFGPPLDTRAEFENRGNIDESIRYLKSLTELVEAKHARVAKLAECYGEKIEYLMTQQTARLGPANPLTAPRLQALLGELEADGHNMETIRKELHSILAEIDRLSSNEVSDR